MNPLSPHTQVACRYRIHPTWLSPLMTNRSSGIVRQSDPPESNPNGIMCRDQDNLPFHCLTPQKGVNSFRYTGVRIQVHLNTNASMHEQTTMGYLGEKVLEWVYAFLWCTCKTVIQLWPDILKYCILISKAPFKSSWFATCLQNVCFLF